MKQTYTETQYLFLTPRPNLEVYPDGYTLSLLPHKYHGSDQDICLTPDGVEVECQVPKLTDDELVRLSIDTLKAKQKEIQREAAEREEQLQHLINKLKLITYQPSEEEESIDKPE